MLDTRKSQISNVSLGSGLNVTFLLSIDNTFGMFRINYSDDSRKNARYQSLRAQDIYFEGFDAVPNKEQYSLTYKVERMTDLMLFAERHKQWLLEKVHSENKDNLRF